MPVYTKPQIQEEFLALLQEKSDKNRAKQRLACFNASDWKSLLDTPIKDGLFPPLYIKLSDLNLKTIPAEFLSQFKNQYLRNLKRNFILEQEHLKVINYLWDEGIQSVYLKGPLWARFFYNDLAARRASCDLDLLVRPEQFNQTKEALERYGYRLSDIPAKVNFRIKYARQLGFTRRVEGVGTFLVDLHYDLPGLYVFFPAQNLWQDLQELDFEGNKILLPSNENLLIYLALTALAVYQFIELRYLYDIYAFIAKFNHALDWDGLAQRLNKRHKTSVFFALALAKKFFKFDLPESFLKKIKPNLTKRLFLGLWINKRNVLNRKPGRGLSWYYFFTSWYYFITSYLYSENILDCLRIIYRKIFLPKVDLATCYDKKLSETGVSLYLKRLLKPVSRLFTGTRLPCPQNM